MSWTDAAPSTAALAGDDFRRLYSLLTRAEHDFRDMRTPLAERPICHQREHRVENHIVDGTRTPQSNGNIMCTGRNCVVVIDPSGRIVTMYQLQIQT